MISRAFSKVNKNQLIKTVSTNRIVACKNNQTQFIQRFSTSTDNSNNNEQNQQQQQQKEQEPKKKMNKFAFWGGLAVAGLGGFWIIDMVVNDDFDSVTDKFRTRLPESERKKRPKVVILGTGWGSLCFLRKLHTDLFDVTIISPR